MLYRLLTAIHSEYTTDAILRVLAQILETRYMFLSGTEERNRAKRELEAVAAAIRLLEQSPTPQEGEAA